MAEPEAEHREHAGTAPEVDENGNPETPAKQAVDKRKKRNLTYAGLALGAIGIVVAIFVSRRNAAAAGSSTTSSGAPVDYGLGTSGNVAGQGSLLGTGASGDPLGSLLAAITAQGQQQAAASRSLQTALTRLTSELHASGGANKGDQARSLPHINSANYASVLAKGTKVDILGAETAPGVYSGSNVKGGAPVYGFIGGQWRQGISPSKAPAGTLFATLPQFAGYIVPPTAPKLPPPVANPPHGTLTKV